MITISPSPAEVNQHGTLQFGASGGTGPYVWTLVSGDGSISSAGLYTATYKISSAVVRVTDSLGATQTATVRVQSALSWLCQIIREELDLDDDQVYLWDQKLFIPSDSRLYVAVGTVSCKPFANTREYVPVEDGGLNCLQSTNFLLTASIDIISRGVDARDRKEEVLMSLKSDYSQGVQQAYGFYVAPLTSSFLNLSEVDGAAIPYRFKLLAALQYKITKTKSVDYYDDFPGFEVLTDPEYEEPEEP